MWTLLRKNRLLISFDPHPPKKQANIASLNNTKVSTIDDSKFFHPFSVINIFVVLFLIMLFPSFNFIWFSTPFPLLPLLNNGN